MELKTDVKSIPVGGSLDNGIKANFSYTHWKHKNIHKIMNPQSFNLPYL